MMNSSEGYEEPCIKYEEHKCRMIAYRNFADPDENL